MNFSGSVRSKLPGVGTTIFTVMSALAREHDAINLSQGFPDFNPDESLQAAVDRAIRGHNNQYAPMAGLLLLRERIAAKVDTIYKATVDPDTEITITAGGTQALFTAIAALISENDEVILLSPAYDSYAPAVTLAGGKAMHYTMEAPDFAINWQQVKKLITQRTRMIVINTPHNPSATVLTEKDMKELEKLTKGTDIIILSDEVYEHITFDDKPHQSVLRYPRLAERSVVVGSFGKTYHATGWKIGYAIAPRELMAEFRKVHQFNVFSVNTPMQYAYAEILQRPDLYEGLSSFYQEKRDFFRTAMKGSKFELLDTQGTYFQLASYKSITDEKDTEVVKWLTKEFKVAAIPVSVFYHKNMDQKIIRFCFAKENETLEKAAEQLSKIK
ncbi:MAG: methionine aminotransferase [Bacteroidetes bacterium]|nr:methionine aminotransferase [Bacteroidota bacterium]